MSLRPVLLLALACAAAAARPQDASVAASFQREVLPLLRRHCQGCHQPAKAGGGLDLTAHAALLAGGRSGAAVVPGDAAGSLLLELVTPRGDEPPEMPKERAALSADEVALLERWIAEGAVSDAAEQQSADAARPARYHRPPVVASLAWSPDGAHLALGGRGEVLVHRLPDAPGGAPALAARLAGLSERIESLAFSPDGTRLAVAGGAPGRFGELQVWTVADLDEPSLALSVPVGHDTLYGASWSPDGTRVAFGGTDHALRAVDARSGEEVLYQGAHEDWVLGTAWSLDGEHLVSVSRDRSMKLVQVATQQFLDNVTSITPGALKGGLMDVARHPERDELLVGGADGTPKVFRMFREEKRVIGDDANLVRTFESLGGRVFSVDWSPDGELAAACSSLAGAGRLLVGRAADGTTVWTRDLPAGAYAVAFRPDGSTVATAGFDGVVRCFDALDGTPRLELCAVPLEDPERTAAATPPGEGR